MKTGFFVAHCYLQPGVSAVVSLQTAAKPHYLYPKALYAEWLISVSQTNKKQIPQSESPWSNSEQVTV